MFRKSLLTSSYIALGVMLWVNNSIADPAISTNSFTSAELDIDEAWRGGAVSAKFGDSPAEHNYTGLIEGFTRNLTWTDDDDGGAIKNYATGYVSSSILGDGYGQVKGSTLLSRRVYDGTNNLGTGSQSLKPFTVEGQGVVSTDLNFKFDGLMVLNEQNADSWAEAVIQYSGYIERFDEDLGERVELEGVGFNGMAAIKQTGTGTGYDNFTINIPETYFAGIEGEDDDINKWYNNNNLNIKRVVVSVIDPQKEISLASLGVGSDTYNEAAEHLDEGRIVYYLVYDETFTFDVNAGEVYYVYMDLSPSVNAGGTTHTNTFALSDFSNTVTYTLSGGDSIATNLYFGSGIGVSNVEIENNDQFGGSNSKINVGAATIKINANNKTLNESFTLIGGNNSKIDTNNNTITIAGNFKGNGIIEGGGNFIATGNVKPGNSIGTLTVNDTTYTQGSGSTLEIEFNNANNDNDKIHATGTGQINIQDNTVLKPIALQNTTGTKTYDFIVSDNNTISGTFTQIENNYALYDFALTKIDGNKKYQLTVDKKSYDSAASNSAAKEVARTLDSILNNGSVPASIQAILDSLDTMTPEEINQAYEQMAPDLSGGAFNISSQTSGYIQNLTSSRISSLNQGISSGDTEKEDAFWVKGFGGQSRQFNKNSYKGYKANTQGFALGLDREYVDNSILGLLTDIQDLTVTALFQELMLKAII